MGRRAIETENHQVHRLLARQSAETLGSKHPRIVRIIAETIEQRLPRQRSPDVLLGILQSCPVITTAAAAEVTGHRYARSTISEYTLLARIASRRIAEHLAA